MLSYVQGYLMSFFKQIQTAAVAILCFLVAYT